MDEQFSVTTTKRKTLYFLLGPLLLSIGMPTYLALEGFHRAGMHPERPVTLLAGVLIVAMAAMFVILRRRR